MTDSRFGKITALMAVMVCLLLLSRPIDGYSQSPAFNEYQVKTVFMYNFAKFTEWPEESLSRTDNDITLCLLGDDPFGEFADNIQGKPVKGRKFMVKRIQSVEQARGCQLLFISQSERDNLEEILKSIEGSSILTIGDTEAYVRHGVMVTLFIRQKTVHFKINADAAARAGLKLSSKLLDLAEIVGEK